MSVVSLDRDYTLSLDSKPQPPRPPQTLRHYGRLFPDPQIENLHHVINCDVADTYAVDFDYSAATGFMHQGAMPPTIQVGLHAPGPY